MATLELANKKGVKIDDEGIHLDGTRVVDFFPEPEPEPEPPPVVEVTSYDLHPGNVMFHVKPEDRQALRTERKFLDGPYHSALHACLTSAIQTMVDTPSTEYGKPQASGNFKSEFPLEIPRGTYKTAAPLVKPGGVAVVGANQMEGVTIRVNEVDPLKEKIEKESVNVGFDITGEMEIAGHRVSNHTMGIFGLRITNGMNQKNPIAAYVLRGHHTNARFEDVGALGSFEDKGFGMVHVNQEEGREYEIKREGFEPIRFTTIQQSAVALDLWLKDFQFERFGVGVWLRGGLGCQLDGSIYYCNQGMMLSSFYHGRTRCWIGDRWNRGPVLGTTKLGVFLAGNGNVLEDHVQHAEDAALVEKGMSNRVRMHRPSRAALYRTCAKVENGRVSGSGRGDLFPLKRLPDGTYQPGSFARFKTGEYSPGGPFTGYEERYKRELGEDNDQSGRS